MPNRRGQRQAFDSLRRPVGGYLRALHAPHLLGVGLEEDVEEPASELVRDPLFEVPGITGRPHARPGVRKHAERGLHDAQLHERVACLERIVEQFVPVVDTGFPWAQYEIIP